MSTRIIKKLIVFCMVFMLVPVSSVWAASVIKDPALAHAIRAELKLPSGKELQAGDVKRLKSLYPTDEKHKITSLQGLEHAVNMESLMLPGHKIKDITAIGKLEKLEFLAIDGNQVTDLSPLSGLSSLQKLIIGGNPITSLEPLKNLSSLTDLLASHNQISDLKPIQNLKLEWLVAEGNKIKDLSPLKNHPTLTHLYLANNSIQNIEVLETIPNLQEVYLANNPLNDQANKVIRKLEYKGVLVDLGEKEMTQPEEIQVFFNSDPVEFDVSPFMKDGSTMVPFRTLFEKLGLKVTWIQDTQTIIGTKEGTTIKMRVGQPSADVNGKKISLAAAPMNVSGSTFVPLRFIAESVDAKVGWDASRKLAVIGTKQRFTSTDGTIEVTAYGTWTTFPNHLKYVKLSIRSFNWSKLVISEIPKQDLPQDMNLDTFYKNTKKQLLAFSGIDVKEESQATFQGHTAKKLIFYLTEEDGSISICTAIFFEADGRFYEFTTSANEDIVEDAQKELNEIIGTMKLSPQ